MCQSPPSLCSHNLNVCAHTKNKFLLFECSIWMIYSNNTHQLICYNILVGNPLILCAVLFKQYIWIRFLLHPTQIDSWPMRWNGNVQTNKSEWQVNKAFKYNIQIYSNDSPCFLLGICRFKLMILNSNGLFEQSTRMNNFIFVGNILLKKSKYRELQRQRKSVKVPDLVCKMATMDPKQQLGPMASMSEAKFISKGSKSREML